MTTMYRIHTRCVREFASWIEVEAATPEEALAKARLEDAELIAAAEDSASWPWNEFAVYDDSGNRLLHVRDSGANLRDSDAALREALQRAEFLMRRVYEGDHEALENLPSATAQARAVLAEATAGAADDQE